MRGVLTLGEALVVLAVFFSPLGYYFNRARTDREKLRRSEAFSRFSAECISRGYRVDLNEDRVHVLGTDGKTLLSLDYNRTDFDALTVGLPYTA